MEDCANASECTNGCVDVKRTYAKVGISIAIFACFVIAVKLVYGKVMTSLFGLDIVNTAWYPWVRRILSTYVIAFPVLYFTLQKIERAEIEKRRMRAGQFICCVFMGFGIMLAGLIIGGIVSVVVPTLEGSGMAKPEQVYGTFWGILTVGVLAPVFEELVFRKLLLDRIHPYGEKTAILVSGLLFGLFNGNFPQFFLTTGLGFFFAYIYLRTGKIWYTMVFHIISNGFFYLTLGILQERDSYILILGWLAILVICGVIGSILFFVKRKKFYPAETLYQPEERNLGIAFGNPGMVCYVVLFILVTLAPSGIGSEADGRYMRQSNWIAEIDGPIRENLKKASGVDEFLSEEERNLRLDALIAEIKAGKLKDDEIVYRIQEIISDIHIGHMAFLASSNYLSKNYDTSFFVCGKWFSDGFYILETLKEDEECLGGKLLAVNGISMEEVLSRYDRIISNETEGFLKDRFERNAKAGLRKSELEYLGISKPGAGQMILTVEKDGVVFEHSIEAVRIDRVQTSQMVELQSEPEKLPYGEKVYRREGQPPFYYEIDKEHRALYLQYNECKDATSGGAGYPYFADFFDELIQDIKANEADIDCFVLDLRNNLGGGEQLWNNAVTKYRTYLEQYPIKILIGKSTYSAAVDAVDMTLHMFDDVTLYGEETGLSVHNYTAVKRITLENTGNLLVITTHKDFCYKIHWRAEDIYAGVMPDVEVMQTFEGYQNGIDEVYLKAVSE